MASASDFCRRPDQIALIVRHHAVGTGDGLLPVESFHMAGGGHIQLLEIALHLWVVHQADAGYRHPRGENQGVQAHGHTQLGPPSTAISSRGVVAASRR